MLRHTPLDPPAPRAGNSARRAEGMSFKFHPFSLHFESLYFVYTLRIAVSVGNTE